MGLPWTPGRGRNIAADKVGTPTPPDTGDDVPFSKLDAGVAGISSPVGNGLSSAVGAMPVVVPNGVGTLLNLWKEGTFQSKTGGPPTNWTGSPPTVTANTSIVVSNNDTVPVGRLDVILGANFGANGLCLGNFSDPNNVQTPDYTSDAWTCSVLIPTAGGGREFPFIAGLALAEYHTAQIAYNPPTTTGVFASGSTQILRLTNDTLYSAKWTMLVVGDSITWTMPGNNGTTQNTSPAATRHDLWPRRIIDRLRDKGASIRHINMGFGGARSDTALTRIRQGKMDIHADIVFIGLGTNDSQNNVVSSSAYQANIAAIGTHFRRINPNVSLVFLGPTDTDDANRLPYLPAIRTAAQTVAGLMGGDSIYIDQSTAMSASQTQFYGDSGPVLHPNTAGHGNDANVIASGVQTMQFYTSKSRLGLSGSF